MNFKKYVFCLSFAAFAIAMDDFGVVMNKQGEQVLPISQQDEIDFARLKPRLRSFKSSLLDQYLVGLEMAEMRPYFEVGRTYHEYRMLEYKLRTALESIQLKQSLDKNVQNQTYYQEQIKQINMLLDYVFFIEYQTKLNDIAAWNATSYDEKKAMIDALPRAEAVVSAEEIKKQQAWAYKMKLEELRASEGSNHHESNAILVKLLLDKITTLDLSDTYNQRLFDMIVDRDQWALKQVLQDYEKFNDVSERDSRRYNKFLWEYVRDPGYDLIIEAFNEDSVNWLLDI